MPRGRGRGILPYHGNENQGNRQFSSAGLPHPFPRTGGFEHGNHSDFNPPNSGYGPPIGKLFY